MYDVKFPGLSLEFTVNPVAFTVFGMDVYWYGIIIATGVVLAVLYGYLMAKSMKIDKDALFDAVLVGIVLGIVGARLYYVIFYPGDKYWQNPMEIFDIRDGGLGIYGGIIGGLLGAVLVMKRKKMNIFAMLDVGSIGFLIGQGIGRWGNFINQEAFGDETNLPWGMISERTIVNGEMTTVHPCFLYESILCILGFVLLHFFTKNMRRYDGQTFLLYVIWYGISRFFIEGLRTDSLMVPYINLKVSQVVAVVSVLIAVAVLVAFRKRTVLAGCGNKAVMMLNEKSEEVVATEVEDKAETMQEEVNENDEDREEE